MYMVLWEKFEEKNTLAMSLSTREVYNLSGESKLRNIKKWITRREVMWSIEVFEVWQRNICHARPSHEAISNWKEQACGSPSESGWEHWESA